MKKLIMTKGLPASGKDTFAKKEMESHPGIYKRVNKDDIRALLDFGVWGRDNEKFVLKVRDMLIELALKEGRSVICSDTNLSDKHAIRLQQLAMAHDAEFEIKDFTDVPLEECIRRDELRTPRVGKKVIMGMYNQFLKKTLPRPIHDPSLPNAIWCDIDGTLALFGDKNPYDRDYLKDDLNEPIAMLVAQQKALGNKIIIVSGRKDIFRAQTEQWLEEKGISYDDLYMRKTQPDGIKEPKDDLVKEEIYNTYIKGKYNILFCLDDRNRVVDKLRSLGLTVLQVADGNF